VQLLEILPGQGKNTTRRPDARGKGGHPAGAEAPRASVHDSEAQRRSTQLGHQDDRSHHGLTIPPSLLLRADQVIE
jgi:hypothetical protein